MELFGTISIIIGILISITTVVVGVKEQDKVALGLGILTAASGTLYLILVSIPSFI